MRIFAAQELFWQKYTAYHRICDRCQVITSLFEKNS